jgi:hypothetical protein
MPAYEICYLEDDGSLACAFSVMFETEMRAKILAHAMKPAECRTLEVWQGKALVYRRPETGEAIDAARAMAHTRAHGYGHQPGFAG